MEEVIEKNELSENDKTSLFYKMLSRRPLIDVVQEEREQKEWAETFENANDLTLYSWRDEWKKNTELNLRHFGYFNRDHSIKVFANELIDKPVILLGAGASLEGNIEYLKLANEHNVPIMACHHALMYLADRGIKPDFVVALDAGKTWTEYWANDKTDWKDIPLLADQTCNHEQIKDWKGPVFWYKSSQPDKGNISKYLKMELDRIIDPMKQGSLIEVGGHVMGAQLAISLGVMAADTIIFAGSDYCFNQTQKFYPFDYKIDQVVPGEDFGSPGKELPAPPPPQGTIFDIFGNNVASNGAYLGFKNVMDLGIKVNAINAYNQGKSLDFINASEGGALGALVGGNSKFMKYMRLEDAIHYATNKVVSKKK